MVNSARKRVLAYAGVLAGCFGITILLHGSQAARRVDDIFYDWMLGRQQEDWTPQSVVVAIDEATLGARGGMRNIRSILAGVIADVNAASPAAVADDVLLADDNLDDDGNAKLEAALRDTKNLILPCDLIAGAHGPKWEDPLPRFARSGVPLGHVYRDLTGADGVNRRVSLEEIADGRRRWALALEAFAAAQEKPIVDSPEDVSIGDAVIPASRGSNGRPIYIRYLRAGIPTVPARVVEQYPERLRGKAVFVGVTALGAHDRPTTPFQQEISGVELHAQIYETIARGRFLTPVRNDVEYLLCAAFAAAAGLIFALRTGWQAYALGGIVLALAAWTPVQFFRHEIVFPFFESVCVAWLATVSAAVFQHFFVQRQLRRTESEKSRYQQALHWAAHEMRTPLTAIQGSSEIMTRYSLPEAKRLQLSEMINSESKRLARMIQTFLDVERLADGQMEMKREQFSAAEIVETCLKRATPIGERKNISIFLDGSVDGTLTGDRELMEYALYNLLTNAVKYSPAGTEVRVSGEVHGGDLRLSVRDQGIGMDAKELKSIFKKFYRTKRAEASGETGTGIGLSIVEQIVSHHGGRIEVTSEPGKGSCFTMVIAASISAAASGAASHNAETSDRRG